MQTIITPGEVVRHSPESSKYPPQSVEKFIFPIEEELARTCLGFDFYDLLIDDLKDWSGIKAWVSGTSYALGDLVNYYGLIIESKVADNTNNPCEDTQGQYWALAAKFSDTCYETLYTRYLRDYLAFMVMQSSLEYTTYPASAMGVQEWMKEGSGSGSKSASRQTFVARKNKALNDAARILENMKSWMLREHSNTNSSDCDFSKVLFIQQCTGTCDAPRQSRRFFFRRQVTPPSLPVAIASSNSNSTTSSSPDQVAVSGSATFTISAGKMLEHVVCIGADGAVKVGTTLGGSEVLDGNISGGSGSFSVFQYFENSAVLYFTGTYTAKLYIV